MNATVEVRMGNEDMVNVKQVLYEDRRPRFCTIDEDVVVNEKCRGPAPRPTDSSAGHL